MQHTAETSAIAGEHEEPSHVGHTHREASPEAAVHPAPSADDWQEAHIQIRNEQTHQLYSDCCHRPPSLPSVLPWVVVCRAASWPQVETAPLQGHLLAPLLTILRSESVKLFRIRWVLDLFCLSLEGAFISSISYSDLISLN